MLIILIFSTSLTTLIECNDGGVESQLVTNHNSFVGSKACRSCHSEAYAEWQGSHHDWAMKKPDSSTVIGDFNTTFKADGVAYQFYKEKDMFKVSVTDLDNIQKTYTIAYTFGIHPLQQYLVEFSDGKFQTLRASWDALENKWFHQYAGQEISTDDWLHWTRGGQRWNTMCADCHSTDVKKNYDLKDNSFNTTYSEINVGCEACHGKGEKHIQWAERGEVGPSFIHLGNSGSQNEELKTCAPCHSRRVKFQEVFGAQSKYDDHFLLQNVSSEYYELDGQIKEEDYVLGSFMQSKMHHKEVKCSNCHNPHTLALKLEGNLLCMQCHDPGLNSPSHHFHDLVIDKVNCVDCHMTGKIYMGNDFRRDHSLRVPRPDLSVKYGVSNACTNCHQDKTDDWAAEQIIQWYGPERKVSPADYMTRLHDREITRNEYAEILQFIQDKSNAPIVRSTLMDMLPGFVSDADAQMLLSSMEDSSSLVRYQALQKARPLALQERLAIALKHLDDASRIVRVCAVNLIVEMDPTQLEQTERQKFLRAEEELVTFLESNADFPIGRLQLGDFYLRRNNYSEAIKHYEISLQMDSLNTAVYGNLATAYNLEGSNSNALHVLNLWVNADSKDARAYYLRSLLKHEMGQTNEALKEMQKAVSLDERNSNYLYNLSVLYLQRKDFVSAKKCAQKAVNIDPESRQKNDLLQLIKDQMSAN